MLWVSERFLILLLSFRPFLKKQAFSLSLSLETLETLCIFVPKLRDGVNDRWIREVQGIRRIHDKEPRLLDFSRFVNEEIILVNDPIFPWEEV